MAENIRSGRNPGMVLGELIYQLDKCDPRKEIYFDFASVQPVDFGWTFDDITQLIIKKGTPDGDEDYTVEDFLEDINHYKADAFEDRSGKLHLMDNDSPIWIGAKNDNGSTILTHVTEERTRVVLHTAFYDYMAGE